MEREHMIILGIALLILYMLNRCPAGCTCGKCMKDKYITQATLPPAHIRYDEGQQDIINVGDYARQHIRYGDKYLGATQHVKQHIRRDNRAGMFNGMFSGSPQHIRYTEDCKLTGEC